MATPAFRVVERFSSRDGDAWRKYVEWSGLTHLAEVVGLDSLLCPSVGAEWRDGDWEHLVWWERLNNCFDDLAYLAERVAHHFDVRRHQFLAVSREPSTSDVAAVDLASRAYAVRDALAAAYPDNHHAQCAVWAIWRRDTQ